MVIATDIRRRALRLSLLLSTLFLVVTLAWILGTDALLLRLASNTEEYVLYQNIKGILFISLMAIGIGILHYKLYLSHETELRARILATTDMVTQLANQPSFMEALATQLKYASAPFGLIFVDAANFGRINSSLGRERGDLLLYRMGHRLSKSAGNDALVARFEADKFAILTPEVRSTKDVEELGERLLDSLNRDYPAGENAIRLDVFGGYAMGGPGYIRDPAGLVSATDAALERAKQESHKRLRRFDPAAEKNISEQFRIEMELRTALQEGQLDVYFQPQVRLADGRIRGAEALARWPHPTRGMISPGVFIPVAEQSGLIEEIGAYVIERTFEWMRELDRNRMSDLVFSINAAGSQLDGGLLPQLLRNAAERFGQPLDRIEVEVTETMALKRPEDSIRHLQKLRDMSISVALDDFGTGVSSLQYLLDLPVDILKIDRSFIAHLPEDRRQARFVRTIIELARDLDLQVVAEGVETEGQRQLLNSLGCHIAQGYLLAKPMSGPEFGTWLEKWGNAAPAQKNSGFF